MKELKVLLVGVGGYAASYIWELKESGAAGGLKIEGAVDPFAKNAGEYQSLCDMGVTFYDTLDEFYAEHTADLAIICTPIPLHAPQSVYCMEHGSHVLCEKPIAGTIADAERMIEARNRTGKFLAIGFQWCYDPAMLAFKKDAQAGLFGELLSMRAIVLWPRDIAYYTRGSGWAGKKYDKKGNPIFDSVASNATAHYLENMLWVAGKNLTDIKAATFRANPIETYDTITLQGKLGNADLFYTASHAIGTEETQEPYFEYTFEKGTVVYGGFGQKGSELVVKAADGTVVKDYSITYNNRRPERMDKLWTIVELIRGEADEIACTAEDALLHTRVMDAVNRQESTPFSEDRVRLEDGRYWVPGLAEALKECFMERKMLNF